MRKTLFRQLISHMLFFCIIAYGIGYAVIEFVFDDYYYTLQESILSERIDELAEQYIQNDLEDMDTVIEYYYSEYGISVHFFDAENNQIYGMSSHGMGRQGLKDAIQQENVGKIFVSTSSCAMGNGQGTRWLSYLAETQDGNYLLGRISYASMDAVVKLVQRFWIYFGTFIAVLFLIFAFIFSRSMSKPLRQLNAIATEMGKLNFSLRYEGNRVDEIGQLGGTLNELTTKLKNAIDQLKGELSKERTLEKMRTQFTAQVSHELQTPLSVIKGYAEALSDNVYTGQEAREAYEILLNEADKISNMVDDLLDLSQMEAGAYVVRKENFDIKALMQKIYKRVRVFKDDKSFAIRLSDTYPENVMLLGDPLRLEQAIRNILTNAIKHVHENGSIEIGLFMQEGKTHITVKNEGETISEDELPHIFDSFYQGKSERTGSGLGLAITRHIIELHDGKIFARNTDGGVLFEIVLP